MAEPTWRVAPNCQIDHDYGEEGWRPGVHPNRHEHLVGGPFAEGNFDDVVRRQEREFAAMGIEVPVRGGDNVPRAPGEAPSHRHRYLASGEGCMDCGANEPDMVNHPPHYKETVPGIECIDVVEHMNFNRGNAIKYVWRAGSKGDEIEDLKKARWYINREIERLEQN